MLTRKNCCLLHWRGVDNMTKTDITTSCPWNSIKDNEWFMKGADPSRCNSTNRLNLPIQQKHHNFWTNNTFYFMTGSTISIRSGVAAPLRYFSQRMRHLTRIIWRMMVVSMLMIIHNSRSILTAVTPTNVTPTAVILWMLVISHKFINNCK